MSAKKLFQSFKEARHKKSLYERVKGFQPKVRMSYDSEGFRVQTAQTGADLLQVLQLRHEIFIREWQGKDFFHGLDVDNFDFLGDHLMIIDKSSDSVIGTYRLLCSRFVSDFYSEQEFDLSLFMRWPSVKLELGRACVHAEHRNGNTIDLLWKGLTRVTELTQAKFLFGCASLKTEDPQTVKALLQDLSGRDQCSDDFQVRPTKKYAFPNFAIESQPSNVSSEVRRLLPPLLRSYLHAGAKVYGEPAWDRDFACTDLLTILDLQQLNRKFRQRYFPSH